jgi:hypothetical protein
MSEIIDYIVEECSSAYALQQNVKNLLQKGWELQGSASVVYKGTVGFSTPVMSYCQALVRRSNNRITRTKGGSQN